jgi:thiol:disulfide interchange protein
MTLRNFILWLFVFLTMLLVWRVSRTPRRAHPDLIQWVAPADAARASRASGKPILYDFTAEWCGPCRRLDRDVFQDAELAQRINLQFVPVRLVDRRREEGRNPPEVESLQTRYGVRAFPTIIFSDADGNVKQRVSGYGGRSRFEDVLAAAVR